VAYVPRKNEAIIGYANRLERVNGEPGQATTEVQEAPASVDGLKGDASRVIEESAWREMEPALRS